MNRECCDAILSGYYVINIVDVMSQIHWESGHTYSGCDIINRVGVMTEIVAVMSHVKCIGFPHAGCGFIYRGCDVICTVV